MLRTIFVLIWFRGVWSEGVASGSVTPPTGDLSTDGGGHVFTAGDLEDVGDDVPVLDTVRYPYRICMSQSTDLVRFDKNIKCVSYSPKATIREGIMVIYKRNIVPYTFSVYTYYKELFFQRSYSYINSNYLLGTDVTRLAMPSWEVDVVNTENACYSSAQRVIGGKTFVSYHRDNYKNETMNLIPDDFYSKNSQRFVTTKEFVHEPGSVWLYKESCNINCVVTVTTGRSNYPYEFFVLSSGEVIEASPFFDGHNSAPFGESLDNFEVRSNYRMLSEFGSRNHPFTVVERMAFLRRPDLTVAWEVKQQKTVTCLLKRWQTVERAIQMEHDDSYHFVSKSLTATFVTSKRSAEYQAAGDGYDCIENDFKSEIDKVYLEEYNETHDKIGDTQIFTSVGGLVIAWQPLEPKSLQALENVTASSRTQTTRRKRDVELPESHLDVTYAQLQFTYDTLRDYINQALGTMAESWCLDQKRTAEMLRELSKISPSSVLSAIYDRPVSARLAGDVIALAECVEVDQASVRILKDMRVVGTDRSTLCYSRPIVLFRFVNSTKTEFGQLGENNEILLGTFRTEYCNVPDRKIFLAGSVAYEYRNYQFKNVTDLRSIEIVNTFIDFNIEPLENTDFKVLELYSRGELTSANVFALEDIMREYNSQKQRIKYLTTKATDSTPPYLAGFDDFMQGLGSAGQGVGVVLGAVGGAITSVVGGVVAFLTNPFGAFTVILVVVFVIVVVFLLYRRQSSAANRPVDYFFPYAAAPSSIVSAGSGVSTYMEYPDYDPPPYEDGMDDDRSGSDEKSALDKNGDRGYSEDEALEMLRAIRRLDETKRKEAGEKGGESSKPSILDRLRYRGYSKVPSAPISED
uniref:Envelope glycoprotein B n=1 Tax=Lemniscomys rat herpesvirus TaxID=3141920 RepID=A0AAU7E275_9VIRU